MRKGPARGPFIHIGSGGLICTDPTVPQNEEFRAYLEEKMSTAPDRQPMPIGVADCSLQRTDRQLWVVSGHSEARKLSDGRIATENASASVCFRP